MAPLPIIVTLLIAAVWSLIGAGVAGRRQASGCRQAYFWLMVAAGAWSLLSALRLLATDLGTKVVLSELMVVPIAATSLLWLLVARAVALALRHTAPLFRLWLVALLVVGVLPIMSNLAFQLGLTPWPGLDPTPLSFALTALLAAWVSLRPQLLDLAPIARGALIEQMADGVVVCDRHWRVVDVNQAALRLAGCGPVALGTELASVLPGLAPALAASAQTGEARELTPEQVPGAWIEVQATPLLGRRGEPLGWLALLRDVTARRAAEAASVELARELRVERDFAFQVIRTMGEGLTVTDATGHFTYVNEAYGRMVGSPPASLIGRSPFELTVEASLPGLHEAFATRRRGLSSTYLSQLRRADGRVIDVQINGVPRFAEDAYSGAVAVVTDLTERKIYEARLLASQLQLAAANARLTELTRTDPLTGLRNRAAFEDRLADEVERARRYGQPLALLMIDIDQFKGYNDSFGHVAGDEVLRAVAALFREQSRQNDLVARYGGEEFAVILPSTDAVGGLVMAERFRAAVAGAPWPLRAITISVGAAIFGPAMGRDELVGSADGALYRAKGRGRNRVALAAGLAAGLPHDDDLGIAPADWHGDVGRLAGLVDPAGHLAAVEGDA